MVLGYWLVRLVGFLMFLPEHSIGFSQLPVDANSLGRLHRIRHLISPPGSHLKEFHQSNLIRMNTSSKSSVSSPEERSSPQDSSLDKLYKVSKWAFGLVSLLLFVIPDSTSTKKLASKWGGAGGFGIAAFVLHILSKDTMPGSVDFVKRCHLGLLGFSFLGILSVPGEAGFWPHGPIVPALLTSSLMTVTRLLGIWVALKGWAFHIKDSSFRWTEELWNGTKDNFKGLRIQDKKKGLFYRNSLLVVWLATISNVFQAKFQLQYQDALEFSFFSTSLYLSAIARLFLVSSILYSLKLAAESATNAEIDRSTFSKLNWALASWAGIVGLGQNISYPFSFSIRRAEMLAFAALLFLKGYKEQKKGETLLGDSSTQSHEDSNDSAS